MDVRKDERRRFRATAVPWAKRGRSVIHKHAKQTTRAPTAALQCQQRRVACPITCIHARPTLTPEEQSLTLAASQVLLRGEDNELASVFFVVVAIELFVALYTPTSEKYISEQHHKRKH